MEITVAEGAFIWAAGCLILLGAFLYPAILATEQVFGQTIKALYTADAITFCDLAARSFHAAGCRTDRELLAMPLLTLLVTDHGGGRTLYDFRCWGKQPDILDSQRHADLIAKIKPATARLITKIGNQNKVTFLVAEFGAETLCLNPFALAKTILAQQGR